MPLEDVERVHCPIGDAIHGDPVGLVARVEMAVGAEAGMRDDKLTVIEDEMPGQ